MISLRTRSFGSDEDWTYIRVEGDNEEELAALVQAAIQLNDPETHLQRADEGEAFEDVLE